jgi:uncharacterized protein with HEPN domain
VSAVDCRSDRGHPPAAFENRHAAIPDEQALTSFRLSIVGENANKLSAGLKARHNDIPWNRMYAFRNIVSHEYHRLDPELVWEAVLGLGAIEAMVDAELGHGD